MQKKAALLILILSPMVIGVTPPVLAACWSNGWGPYASCLPAGFYGCIPHLGLGPGYPGLFPPTYICPPGFGFPAMPYQTLVVIPGPPAPVYVNPEDRIVSNQPSEHSESDSTSRAADYSAEVERARRLYPNGIPSIEYVWSADRGSEKLHDTPSK
jgi:hypothetical protein